MKKTYLPKAKNGFCFTVVGSKLCFFSAVFTALALAIIAVCGIIIAVKKSRK